LRCMKIYVRERQKVGTGVKQPRFRIVAIVEEQAEQLMGKPRGNYITIEAPALRDNNRVARQEVAEILARQLASLLNLPENANILLVGLGNWHATPDALGPRVIDKLDDMSTIEKLRLSDTRQDEAWAAAHPEMVSRAEAQFQASREALRVNPALLRGYSNQVNAVLKHDTFDRLPQITAPTLVFGGRYDGSCPPEIIRAMAGQIPGARFELLESGHGNWYFDPAAWEMIIGFLRD